MRFPRPLRDASLRRKLTLVLALVFAGSLGLLLLALVPLLGEQRQRLLDQDKRLLSTLRRNYERMFVYDQLYGDRESLALHLQDLATQEGIVWVRVEAPRLDLRATADPASIRRLLGADAEPFLGQPDVVLLVAEDGEADLVGAGGRQLLSGRRVRGEEVRTPRPSVAGQDQFQEALVGGQRVLALSSTLTAAGDASYGRLHILKSLALLDRSEALTRRLFYGGITLSFLAVLLLLNILLSRMVLAPVRRVNEALARAATGDLSARLPVHSRDEVGSIAESFNRMIGELEASRREIEGYSRNLEAMVEARTGELRASQATLLALKNHLATVIANVGTGVVSLDRAGRIETFNGRAGEILGLAPEAASGRNLEEALGATPLAGVVQAVAVVRGGRQQRHEAQVVCELPQGRRTLSVTASALLGEGREPIGTVVVIEDLTHILASQRLEAWKEAVERVIHEIKNPLTPVGLAAQTLKTAWSHDRARFADLFPSAIDMILGAVRDLKDLIGEFSRFSRLPAMHAERLSPNALVEEALSPYRQDAGATRVVVDLAPGLPEVDADPDQLKRVLLNVINNALEAMAERGGELRLRTSAADGGVVIQVEDDGPGVEDVERIFEPHYTTKVKGTGLGLAIARQIVEEHGGRIVAASRPGEGMRVRIFLPAAAVRASV